MTHDPEEMPALDPGAAAVLATYRRGSAMPSDARRRVQARLRAPAAPVAVLAERRRSLRGWAVALTAAAALALMWALDTRRRGEDMGTDAAMMSPSQATRGSSSKQTSARTPGGAAEVTPPARSVAPVEDTSAVTGSASRVTLPGTARRPSGASRKLDAPAGQPPRATGDPPNSAASDLREETEVLARGWRALAAGDVATATAAVDEHARRFVAGALAPERAALAAVSACTEVPERGEALARAFLAEHPRSPLTRRVRDVCKLAP